MSVQSKYFIACIIASTLSGCYGLGFLHQTVNKSSTADLKFNSKYSYISAGQHKEDVVGLWGKPRKEKVLDEKNEIWSYQCEVGFSGLVIGIGIPIPIVIPMCERKHVYFTDGSVAYITNEHSELVWFCGAMPDLSIGGYLWTCH